MAPNFGTGINAGFINGSWDGVYLSLGAIYSGAFTGSFLALQWGSFASFDATPSGGFALPFIDSTSKVAYTVGGGVAETAGYGGDGVIQKSGAPSTAELPIVGTVAVFKDTSGGSIQQVYNDAGTIRRIAENINGSNVVGNGAIATNATDGFLYIPTCAGTPTGTPTTVTGFVPLVYDTTNNQFWIYNGSWLQPKTPAGAAIVHWQ